MAGRSKQVDFFPSGSPRKAAPIDSVAQVYSVFHPSGHPPTTLPTVSVVICTRNRPDALRQCLQQLSKLTLAPDEILVVDNSSGDEATRQLARNFGVRYVVERVRGLSRARNTGLSESRCDVVAFLDDDCIPDSRWLEYLLIPFTDQRVAAVTGEIIRFSDDEPRIADKSSALGGLRYVTRDTSRWFEMATFGGIGSGGNMAFRRTACQEADLFDERLGRGAPFRLAEENCAFVRLLAQGNAAVRIREARVYHPEKERDSDQEAASSIAYGLFLMENFPQNRLDLVRFLTRRFLRKPLGWRLEAQQEDGIVSSGLSAKLHAGVRGLAMFYRARGLSRNKKGPVRTGDVPITS